MTTRDSESVTNPWSAAKQASCCGIHRWIPILTVLRTYSTVDWVQDIVAGLVLSMFLIPAGMGYAIAAGLPAVCGLYATICPLIAYAILGPSRILVLGPDSALAAVIAATIVPLSAGNEERAIVLAAVLAILSGMLCIVAGVARIGFVTELLSKPIRYGYLNGIAIAVIIAQLPVMLGFSTRGKDAYEQLLGLLQDVRQGHTNWVACAVSSLCLLVILGLKRWAPRLPGILIVVVGAILAVASLDLADQAQLSVIGSLPQGLPDFRIPKVGLADLRSLLSGAVAIAVVSVTDMSVLSRALAHRRGEPVHANQELVTLGVANVVAGLFQGFSISSSSSRTPIAESAGARSQLAGVVGALCIAVVLAFAPTLLQNLPHAVLSAVVVSACLGLIEIGGVIRLYRLRPSELAYSVVCFLGVLLVGVVPGIFIAVSLALLEFIWRAWRPHDAILGRVDGLGGYHDISRHPEANCIPGLVLFRWDAPLFFANAAVFQEHVLHAVATAPTPTKCLVVTAEPVTDIDITAAEMLTELHLRLRQAGTDLCFAEMKGPVKDRLKRYGLFTAIGPENFFPTVELAVIRHLATHQVEESDRERHS